MQYQTARKQRPAKKCRYPRANSLNKAYPTMEFNDDDSVYFIGKVIGLLDPYEDIASEEDIQKYQRVYGDD